MKEILYKSLISTGKYCGIFIIRIIVWFITTGHVVFLPLRFATSIKFYSVVFPDKSFFYHLYCSWKQYHNFSKVYINRHLYNTEGTFQYTTNGLKNLDLTIRNNMGAILLMSHMGNWELAAQVLGKRGFRLLLYMGVKNKEQLEKVQKDSLRNAGIKIIAIEKDGGSPLDIIDGIRFIKSGGLVSLTGDRLWSPEQRSIGVQFFGHEIHIPQAPYLLAHLSGAPIFIFFAYQTGKHTFNFEISKPILVSAPSRAERESAILHTAQQYATILEKNVQKHPFDWFHFEPYLNKKV